MIEIRRARPSDLPGIRRLTLETAAYSIPEGRDIPNQVVVERAGQPLEGLADALRRPRDVAVVVATEGEELVGFLILEFNHLEETTGEKQSYIYNLVVDPRHWGIYLGQRLVLEAARLTHRRGYRYMTARVSACNERTLLPALKMGFEIERYQLVMACGPEGPQPMTGRAPEERAYALSRLRRKVASHEK